MGALICQKNHQGIDPYQFRYGIDESQRIPTHLQREQIICDVQSTRQYLISFAEKIRAEKSLYKDPYMSAQPFKLISPTLTIQCVYKRPYEFIQQLDFVSGYKICKSQYTKPYHIEVKDKLMQNFGIFLCFVSDHPQLINQIIQANGNGYGINCISSYHNGKIRKFLIDDLILCQKNGGTLFSSPQVQEVNGKKTYYLWPCLIQKAWLKIKNYSDNPSKLKSNDPQEIFKTFLNLPIKRLYLDKDWNKAKYQIQSLYHQKFDMQSNRFLFKTKSNPTHIIGFEPNKWFYTLDAFQDNNQRYYLLKNPCEQSVFRGNKNRIDESVRNYRELKKYLDEDINSGIILLSEEQLTDNFQEAIIIGYDKRKKISVGNYSLKNKQERFIQFETFSDTKKTIYLWAQILNAQKDTDVIFHLLKQKTYQKPRSRKKSQQVSALSRESLQESQSMIKSSSRSELHQKKYQLISDSRYLQTLSHYLTKKHKNEDMISAKINILHNFHQKLTRGKYLLRFKPKAPSKSEQIFRFILMAYHKQSIMMREQSDKKQQSQRKDMWLEFLKQNAKQQLKNKRKVQDISGLAKLVQCQLGDIDYLYIEKNKNTKTKNKNNKFFLEVNFNETENLQCLTHPYLIDNKDFTKITLIKDYLLIIFEKKDLKKQARLGNYYVDAY